MPVANPHEIDLEKDISMHKVVVVGSGFFGLTLAERISDRYQIPVLVIEKRNHIGGNAFSYLNTDTGIEIHKYGTHIFHTKNLTVMNYFNKFGSLNSYRHEVEADIGGDLFPIPINLTTLKLLFGREFTTQGALAFLENERKLAGEAVSINAKTKAISLVGKRLYEAFYEGYTKKQWGIDPTFLPPDIITRIPVRTDYNPFYFDDPFQGVPTDGYGNLFENMVKSKNVKVILGVDFMEVKSFVRGDQLLIYSGAIDRFFDFREGPLGWRTVDFDIQVVDKPFFQSKAVINYPQESIPFTRIHEFKHLHPERVYSSNKTVIAKEFSRLSSSTDEPYYPINTSEDRSRNTIYQNLVKEKRNLIVGGRLGRYQYLDMHMAIGNALNVFKNDIPTFLKRLEII